MALLLSYVVGVCSQAKVMKVGLDFADSCQKLIFNRYSIPHPALEKYTGVVSGDTLNQLNRTVQLIKAAILNAFEILISLRSKSN